MLTKLKPTSEFRRNVLTLMTGTTIAQAIPVAISPILTRIYTPEDFGVYALFIAIAAIFGTIVNGRYEQAIMLPKKDEDAINIFALAFIINVFITIILFLIVFLFNSQLVVLFNNEDIAFWLYFVPVAVFFTGIFNSLKYFNIRKKNYKHIANATITKSIVLAIFQIILGLLKQGPSGLINGHLISHFFANLKLFRNISKEFNLLQTIKSLKMIVLAKKNKDFPLHNAPASLFDTATLQLPFLLLPVFFTLTIAGYFMLAKKILSIPSRLIATSVSQVFFQTMVERKNNSKKCMPVFLNTLKKLSFIAFPIAFILFFISPYLFGVVFGNDWEIAGEVTKYLAFVFFITFTVSSVSSVLSVGGFIKRGALWKYLYFTTSILLFGFSYIQEIDFFTFLFIFVIHEYLLYGLYLYLMIITVKQIDKGLVKCVE